MGLVKISEDGWDAFESTLGNKIRFLRYRLSLSVRRAAQIAGIRAATWCEIETDVRQPHGETLCRICVTLGVRPCDLIRLSLFNFRAMTAHARSAREAQK